MTSRVIIGDARTALRELEPECVQMCVTSPPYWRLRDYGHPDQIGQEDTPEAYVEAIVQVMREVRRVLKDDGTLWLNIGDSYVGARGGAQGKNGAFASKGTALSGARVRDSTTKVDGLGYKSLIGIPWRVAFGLMDDGWTLRSEIIWHKPNPLPESVRDRPTKSHEHLFLFSKSEVYYYDADAIAERATESRVRSPRAQRKHGEDDPRFQTRKNLAAVEPREVRNARDVWTIDEDEFEQFMAWKEDCERDASDVWKLATQRYSGAHFAAMPPRLAERCIKAGSRFGDRVLDPFFGSGTVGKECDVLGRLWYGCEIQSDYAPLIAERTVQSGLVPQGES